MDTQRLLDRLQDALNSRDIDALLDCFTEDFHRKDPSHPGREFVGQANLRVVWENVFVLSPEFSADLVRSSVHEGTVWAEWYWRDVPTGGEFIDIAGITVLEREGDRFGSVTMHMQPVEKDERQVTDEAKPVPVKL